MRILLIGGSKSGKSTAAQHLCRTLAAGGPLYYWATMTPRDDEDRARVLRHIADRDGWGFETIECSTGLTAALPRLERSGAVLLDSVTAALSEAMFGPEIDADAADTVVAELLAGKLDGAYIETAVAESYAKQYPDLCVAMDVPYDVAGSAVGVSKGYV